MRPLVNLLGAITFFTCIFSSTAVEAQRVLWEINTTHALPCFLEIDSIYSPHSQYSFQLIRMQNDWYAVGDGTGLVYKKDQNNHWNRIDSTRFSGYHFGANLFEYNNTLYKYGGYGFWRNNGYFVKFEEQKGNWEISPTNIELPTNNKLLFYNQTNHTLLSFGNNRYNQVNSNNYVYIDSLFRIDLAEMKWQNLGAISQKCVSEFNLQKRSETLSNNQYCLLFGTTETPRPFCIDFKNMQFGELIIHEGTSLLFDRIIHPNDSTFCVTDGLHIYLINKRNFEVLEKKSWSELEKFNGISEPLITYDTSYLLWTSALLTGILIIVLLVRSHRKKGKETQQQTFQRSNELHFLSKNRIRFKGAIYQLNELDIRHLKIISKKKGEQFSIADLQAEIGKQSKHLEISQQNVLDWIIRMNAFFITIGLNQHLIEIQGENLSILNNIRISFEEK